VNVREVSVTFTCTIPTQPFGNVGVNVTWSGAMDGDETPETATQDIFNRIRAEVSAAVKPIAAARLSQMEEVIASLPAKERDALRAKLGPVEWLRVVAPEAQFGAPAEVSNAD
jgi:hypothetical protein